MVRRLCGRPYMCFLLSVHASGLLSLHSALIYRASKYTVASLLLFVSSSLRPFLPSVAIGRPQRGLRVTLSLVGCVCLPFLVACFSREAPAAKEKHLKKRHAAKHDR